MVMAASALCSVLCALAFLFPSQSTCWGVMPQSPTRHWSRTGSSQLFSTEPRRPRRALQKRRRKRERQQQGQLLAPQYKNQGGSDGSEELLSTEIRPLVAAKERGLDYWIDEADLRREKERRARKPPEAGQISQDRLRAEVVSPYKQNWIGLISVLFVVLAMIISQQPELLEYPQIRIPDL